MPDNNLTDAVAEGRALLAEATEGPWEADGSEIYRADAYEDGTGRRVWVGETCDVDNDSLGDANAALIVWMRNNLPDLLDRIETLQLGGQTLGKSLVTLNQIALDATGMHDVINENGDGDWGAVWENVADLGVDLRAAKKRIAEVEAERDAAISIARSNSHALDKAQADMETTAIELLAAHRRIAELEATQRHRLVETAEELDALPIGSVVLTIESRTAWENIAESVSLWANCGAALTAANLLHNYGTVIVVWTPELEAQVQR